MTDKPESQNVRKAVILGEVRTSFFEIDIFIAAKVLTDFPQN